MLLNLAYEYIFLFQNCLAEFFIKESCMVYETNQWKHSRPQTLIILDRQHI